MSKEKYRKEKYRKEKYRNGKMSKISTDKTCFIFDMTLTL